MHPSTTLTFDSPAQPADQEDALIGALFGPYRVLERIGVGAMGAVYRSRRVATGDEVALKILLTDPAHRTTFINRLRREAWAAARIDHPNIVKVLDSGVGPESTPYLVMELVHGRTLAELLADEGQLDPPRAARLIGEIAKGLDAAHGAGFIHRDLKPANVMVSGDAPLERVKILDLGIVGLADRDRQTRLTQEGLMIGTPTYMAPEQVISPQVTASADLYALGVILYEMLAGRPPFVGCLKEVIAHHVAALPEPLAIAGGLEKLAHALLAKAPEDRPASAKAVAAKIDRLLPKLTQRERVTQTRSSSAGQRTLIVERTAAQDLVPAMLREVSDPWASRLVIPVRSGRWLRWPIRVATFVLAGVLGASAAARLMPPREGSAALVTISVPVLADRTKRRIDAPSSPPIQPAPSVRVEAARPAPRLVARPPAARRLSPLELARYKLALISRGFAASAVRLSAGELEVIEERYLELSALAHPGFEDVVYRAIAAEADGLLERMPRARRPERS